MRMSNHQFITTSQSFLGVLLKTVRDMKHTRHEAYKQVHLQMVNKNEGFGVAYSKSELKLS